MMKNLLERAAELVRKTSGAAELLTIHNEIQQRITAIEAELREARTKVDTADTVAEAEQAEKNVNRLQAESRILFRRRTDIHEQRKMVVGAEAVKKAPQIKKRVAEAASTLAAAIAEAEAAANELRSARAQAKEVGQRIEIDDSEVVYQLAEQLHGEQAARDQFVAGFGLQPRGGRRMTIGRPFAA